MTTTLTAPAPADTVTCHCGTPLTADTAELPPAGCDTGPLCDDDVDDHIAGCRTCQVEVAGSVDLS